MNPVTPIYSEKFVYTDSARTNIRERFDQIRAEQKQKLIVDNVLAVSVAAWSKNES